MWPATTATPCIRPQANREQHQQHQLQSAARHSRKSWTLPQIHSTGLHTQRGMTRRLLTNASPAAQPWGSSQWGLRNPLTHRPAAPSGHSTAWHGMARHDARQLPCAPCLVVRQTCLKQCAICALAGVQEASRLTASGSLGLSASHCSPVSSSTADKRMPSTSARDWLLLASTTGAICKAQPRGSSSGGRTSIEGGVLCCAAGWLQRQWTTQKDTLAASTASTAPARCC